MKINQPPRRSLLSAGKELLMQRLLCCWLPVTVRLLAAGLLVALLIPLRPHAEEAPRLTLLLLGDRGPHRPAEFARILTPILNKAGIGVTYTDRVEDLNAANLARYQALAIFRDSGDLPEKEETALRDFI